MFNKSILIALSFIFILLSASIHAQDFSEKQLRSWSKNPEWISMIENPNANYYETVAAFDAFWKDRQLPVEEDQLFRAPRHERENHETARQYRKRLKAEKKMKKAEKEESEIRYKYAFAVKKYRHWLIQVEPYVQSDGKILTKEEQLLLHQQQR